MEKKNVASADDQSDLTPFQKFLANTGGAKLLFGGILATEKAKETTNETLDKIEELNPITAAGNYMQRGLLMLLAIALLIVGFYFMFKAGVLNET